MVFEIEIQKGIRASLVPVLAVFIILYIFGLILNLTRKCYL